MKLFDVREIHRTLDDGKSIDSINMCCNQRLPMAIKTSLSTGKSMFFRCMSFERNDFFIPKNLKILPHVRKSFSS